VIGFSSEKAYNNTMNVNVNKLTSDQINKELVARHSRTSGTLESRRQRLQRFLDFENQKERRNKFVKEMMVRNEEEEAGLECYDGCPCNYNYNYNYNCEETETETDTLAAESLLNLYRAPAPAPAPAPAISTDIEILFGENQRLNERINNLETRLSHLENRSDSPPPLIFQESNPQWVLDTAFISNH
jgi:hypothetical protein